MPNTCPICEGSGLRVIEREGGVRVARECACRAESRARRLVEQARIPERYKNCRLEDFIPDYAGYNASLVAALIHAQKFVQAYPVETDGKGLMLIGSVGIGKTHLAVGILQALIVERGAHGIFCDYRDLLKRIQDSYGRNDLSEREILRPIFESEVLVIDELGAAKPTEWVWDTVQHILNTRYNDRRTTIITTNYPNLSEVTRETVEAMNDAQKSMRDQTLGDRITDRMRSRLQEMCVVIEMQGQDFRQKVKRANFKTVNTTASATLPNLEASSNTMPEALGRELEERLFAATVNLSAKSTQGSESNGEITGARSLAKYASK